MNNTNTSNAPAQEQKFYPLQLDFMFKALFGQETPNSKTLLKDLLNTILNRPANDQITTITLKNPFSINDHVDDKTTISSSAKTLKSTMYNSHTSMIK